MYTYSYQTPKRKRPHSALRIGKAVCTPFANFGKDFCEETSIHGFNHIAEQKRHWVERVLWMCVTSLAIWGALNVSLGQLQRYNENPTVVTLEKDFRSWRFSLPGVTVCHKDRVSQKKLAEVIKNIWEVEPADEKYDYYVKFLDVVANSDILHLEGYQEFEGDEELDVDLYDLVVDLLPELDAKGLTSVDASLRWTQVMTETGACYSTNSLAINDIALSKINLNHTKDFPLKCTYTAMSCYLMFDIAGYNKFYIHSPYDILDVAIPSINTFPGLTRVVDISVMETSAGRGVKELSTNRRGCLYADEPTLKGRQIYSTNSCILNCRSKVALKYCKCIPFYYFYEDGPPCTPSGMACLAKISDKLARNDGVKCPCSSQCIYATFAEDDRTDTVWDGTKIIQSTTIRFSLQPPTTRYTREIVFHFQDLIVSFGGAAGLFLGASFISFVEILYFILTKIFRAVSLQPPPTPTTVNVNVKESFEMRRVKELTSMLEENQPNTFHRYH